MSMPVESHLQRQLSTTCKRFPRRAPSTATTRARHHPTHHRLNAHSGCWVRWPKALGLTVVLWTLLLGWPPAALPAEDVEKQPLKLPEVVILGQDVSVLKEAKERLVPQELTPTLKQIPAEARENIDLSGVDQAGKSSPQASSPGCLFGNPVTGSIAQAFLGDEAQYKVGLYRYQSGDYQGAIEAFSRVHQDYPQSSFRGAAYYWEGESRYQLRQYDRAQAAFQQVIQRFPGCAHSVRQRPSRSCASC
jgi:hypothetical protein